MKSVSSKIKFITSVFGKPTAARDGTNVAVQCPVCITSSKKKFSINLETWQCHCWVCGVKGKTLEPILKKYFSRESCDQFLTEFLGKSSTRDLVSSPEKVELKLPQNFSLLVDNLKTRDPDIRSAIRYLVGRGLSIDDFWYFKLGTVSSGRYCKRVIMPSFDCDGELNFYASRSIYPASNFKYLNARTDKTVIIFNEINIDWSKELTIVEGPFDLVKANHNATCLLGAGINEGSLLFKRIVANSTPELLALDSDMERKAYQYAKMFSEYCCDVRMLNLGRFKDVGEMSRDQFRELRKSAIYYDRQSAIKSKINSLQSGSLF